MANKEQSGVSRRGFLYGAGIGSAGLVGAADAPRDARGKVIPGFEENDADSRKGEGWQPFSDRKIRVGIAGYGLCRFGAAFGFQNHPNVEVIAVTDLIPDHCAPVRPARRRTHEGPAIRPVNEGTLSE